MISAKSLSFCYWMADMIHPQKHKCGYCKNEFGSISHGMWAEKLSVSDYQALIDRGWRRSGNYIYKPIMTETCCPQYTIRCEALNFKINKSHKKCIKKFNKFINTGELNKTSSVNDDLECSNTEEPPSEMFLVKHPKLTGNVDKIKNIEKCINENSSSGSKSPKNIINDSQPVQQPESSLGQINKSNASYKKGVGADPSKSPCKKAKLLRLERKQKKLQEKGLSFEKSTLNNSEIKNVEDLLKEIGDDSKYKLNTKIISVNKPGIEWEYSEKVEFELFKKYQIAIHNEPPQKCSLHQFRRFLISSPLGITLERLNENSSNFQVSAKLFEKYQTIVHTDSLEDCDVNQFHSFLIETPLKYAAFEDGSELGYGTFHQQYWIDDKLIAVGVIDILPNCITSVYFFYDPDYRNLTLGTYGSLKEISFVRYINTIMPEIKYYYLGYYIHSCPKMRYKGKLKPSYLLCPETYEWFPIENCLPKLEISKYTRFHEDLDVIDSNVCQETDVDNIKILVGHRLQILKNSLVNLTRNQFQIMANLIGKATLKNMVVLFE